jgi:uncharacterized phiE125 gp8 family phage protein
VSPCPTEGRVSLVGYGATGAESTPIAEPLTLDAAKQQVRRRDTTDDDVLLEDILIPAARERAEQATRRQFITATYDLTLDGRFPGEIVLPLPPLQSVLSVTYVDDDGVTQTLATNQYTVDAPSGPRAQRGRIVPAYNVTWPGTRYQINAVTVRFVAGYGDDHTAVPPRLKMAMLQDVATLYENREDVVLGQGYSVIAFPSGSTATYANFRSHG